MTDMDWQTDEEEWARREREEWARRAEQEWWAWRASLSAAHVAQSVRDIWGTPGSVLWRWVAGDESEIPVEAYDLQVEMGFEAGDEDELMGAAESPEDFRDVLLRVVAWEKTTPGGCDLLSPPPPSPQLAIPDIYAPAPAPRARRPVPPPAPRPAPSDFKQVRENLDAEDAFLLDELLKNTSLAKIGKLLHEKYPETWSAPIEPWPLKSLVNSLSAQFGFDKAEPGMQRQRLMTAAALAARLG